MTTLNFSSPTDRTGGIKSQTVYVKAKWSDEWTQVNYLWCASARWRRAPDMSTAEFVWTYGHGRRQFESQFAHVLREQRPQFYVKVEFQTFAIAAESGTPRVWYGVFEAERDNFGGAVTRVVATDGGGQETYKMDHGHQLFQAVGLEILLERHYLLAATWHDESAGEDVDPVVWTNRGLTFNAGGWPNRTHSKKQGHYRFSELVNTPYWTSRQIVEYLIGVHAPTSIASEPEAENVWAVKSADLLTNFDRPVIDTHGRTLRSVLNQVIAPERMRSYYVTVDETGEEPKITVNVIALNAESVSLADGELVPAPNRVSIEADQDPSSNAIIRELSIGTVGQVVLQGARRRHLFTQSVGTGDLEIRHSAEEKTAYDTPTPTGMPAAAEKAERAKRLYIARAATLAQRAYLRWTLPEDWDFLTQGGDADEEIRVTVFNRLDGEPGRPYRKELKFLPTIPLLSGYDYSGSLSSATPVGGPPYREMQPLVAVAIPSEDTPQRYINLADMGRVDLEELPDGDNWELSGAASVAPDGALEIYLNAPQNSIAGGGTTDADRFDYGDLDYTNWLITVAVEDDEHCEARYPETLDDEFARRVFIPVGNAFRHDIAAWQTVIAIDADGLPVRTVGGTIRDDYPELERKAKIAHAWLNTPRRVLQFATQRITGEIELGDCVTDYGSEQQLSGGNVDTQNRTINTVVSEIIFECPPFGEAAPSMALTTDATELDILGV